MATPRRLLALSGTSRPGNFTSMALAVSTERLRQIGEDVEVVDARDLTLGFPGLPQTPDARRLITAAKAAHGVVLATPEYHGTFCAMTKLIIENLGFPSALAEKPIALVGVASGRIGAIKSIEHLRGVMAHIGALVVPGSISVSAIHAAFDPETGSCTDAATESALRGIADALVTFMQQYVCPRYILEAQVRDNPSAPVVTAQ